MGAISAGFPPAPLVVSAGLMLSRGKPCDNVPTVGSKKLALGLLGAALFALGALAPAALARTAFRPRIGHAFGLIPAHGHQSDPAAGAISIPLVYHGGSVMRDVHIHTIFWAAPGFKFDGPPASGAFSYRGQIERFLGDVAHDSGSTGNVFSVLGQYPDGSGPGSYRITYDPSTDSISDGNPYPAGSRQCVSASGIATCVTDLQLQQEIDRNVQAHDPGGRGLHDVWFVFLPPDVDTCIAVGSCGTNAYAGYHSALERRSRRVDLLGHPRSADRVQSAAGERPAGQPRG